MPRPAHARPSRDADIGARGIRPLYSEWMDVRAYVKLLCVGVPCSLSLSAADAQATQVRWILMG